MKLFLHCLIVMFFAAHCQGQVSGSFRNDSKNEVDRSPKSDADKTLEIRIVSIPKKSVVMRTITGSYAQHLKIFEEFNTQLRNNGDEKPIDQFIGIYPTDPEAVESANQLKWMVAVENKGKVKSEVSKPYELSTLEKTMALTHQTRVDQMGNAGLAMTIWLQENGYVQTGPTRTVFDLMDIDDNSDDQATIVIPIKKRKSPMSVEGIELKLVEDHSEK